MLLLDVIQKHLLMTVGLDYQVENCTMLQPIVGPYMASRGLNKYAG